MTKKEMLANIPFTVQTSKIIANNTVYYEDRTGNAYIRLYKTDVVIKYKDKPEARLSSGGYKTKTTKDRINLGLDKFFGPTVWAIEQSNRTWYLSNGKTVIPFFDGMHVKFTNGEADVLNAFGNDTKHTQELNKKVDEYSKKFIEKFMQGEIPPPSNADCWFCALYPSSTSEHIESHLEEPYYVPSLLHNSIFNNPLSSVSPIVKTYVKTMWKISNYPKSDFEPFKDTIREQLTTNLKKYLRRKLGLPI